MYRSSLLFLLLIILASCYRDNTEHVEFKKELIIPADKMEAVLTDMFLIEGAASYLTNKGKPANNKAKRYYEAVLEKHGVTEQQFEESMQYYAYHIDELDEIFEKVIINLSKLESEVQSEPEKEKEEEKE
jgi:hypothetical protein